MDSPFVNRLRIYPINAYKKSVINAIKGFRWAFGKNETDFFKQLNAWPAAFTVKEVMAIGDELLEHPLVSEYLLFIFLSEMNKRYTEAKNKSEISSCLRLFVSDRLGNTVHKSGLVECFDKFTLASQPVIVIDDTLRGFLRDNLPNVLYILDEHNQALTEPKEKLVKDIMQFIIDLNDDAARLNSKQDVTSMLSTKSKELSKLLKAISDLREETPECLRKAQDFLKRVREISNNPRSVTPSTDFLQKIKDMYDN